MIIQRKNKKRKNLMIMEIFLALGLAFSGCGGNETSESEIVETLVAGNDTIMFEDYNDAMSFWMETVGNNSSYDFQELQEADLAYMDFFLQQIFAEDFHFIDSVRYQFIYLDEDDCPELFLSEGSGTAFPFRLYRYNSDSSEIEYVASFSQQGRVRYLEKEKQIISVYGNMGYYATMVSEVNGRQVTLLGAILSNGGNPEMTYYIDFPLPRTLQGQHEPDIMSLLPEMEPKYQVSEEEYEIRYQELVDESKVKTVIYNDMRSLP